MKYSDVKDKIKKYFEEVDPDYLYDLAISCGFKQVNKEEKELQVEANFENRRVTYYVVLEKKSHKNSEENNDYLATA